MDIILVRGLRFTSDLRNVPTLLTKYFPLSACCPCRIETTSWKAIRIFRTSTNAVRTIRLVSLAERYPFHRIASRNSLGLVNHILACQKSLKENVNKNGVTLAYYSDFKQKSEGDCQEPQAEKKVTIFQKMKQMTKDYWHILIPVHFVTSAGWVAIFYTAVRNGVDIVQLLEYLNFSEKYVNLVRNSSAGNWAITYALYKIFTPLRYTVTVGGTTIAVRHLSKLGYVKAPPSFRRQPVEPARKIMTNTVKQMCSGTQDKIQGRL
ncbi:PREDICTED: uncharacterized protein C18orf19 homolog A isoform X2 [Dinoponera quadriceps]|uniref:Uncharacterized protein C18orf19 homolog A isoform X2 n=1 Tax=Dinoponera quadriceps TaxID=609295 RepID=A0A6P3X766_DINQU|nr:PREDICTED: uncharacterized protein C18orf19 homolog A isoform X2 [Dinoponera quadriceps]